MGWNEDFSSHARAGGEGCHGSASIAGRIFSDMRDSLVGKDVDHQFGAPVFERCGWSEILRLDPDVVVIECQRQQGSPTSAHDYLWFIKIQPIKSFISPDRCFGGID